MKVLTAVTTSLLALALGAPALAHQPQSEASATTPTTPASLRVDVSTHPVTDGDLESFAAAVSGTPLYTNATTSNTLHEIETAVTATKVSGTDRTAGAYMRYSSNVFRINTISSSTPASSSMSHWVRTTPGLPSGHAHSVDPVLDSSLYDDGVAPRRMYLGGLTYPASGSPRAIVVWTSSDGGQSWSSTPVTVESLATSTASLDKPDLVVSGYPSSKGWVYVTYLRIKYSGGAWVNEVYVERSTDGGATFPSKVLLGTGHYQAPQVVASSNTGKVYVIWTDLDTQQLRMVSSTYNNFTTWTTLASVTTPGRFLRPNELGVHDNIAGDPTVCANGLQAVTVPQARYNWIKDQIGVVWHARETNNVTAKTDVFFSAYGVAGWSTPKRVNPTQTNDQWYPALDYDSTGDYIVVFYDRSQDPGNLNYRQAWAHLNSAGTRLASGYVTGVFDSDPSEVYVGNGVCFKGDYQDIWFWPYTDASGPRFHALWTGHPPSPTNIDDEVYLSAIK